MASVKRECNRELNEDGDKMSGYIDVFKRMEIKYLLSHEQYERLQEFLKDYARVDDYGKTRINNIYFDTPDFSLIRTSLEKPVYKNIYLVDSRTAEHLFLAPSDEGTKLADINFRKIKDCGSPRTISIGKAKVAEAPTDADFNSASVYEISLPENRDALMAINYRGDMARLYADGKLIADNFYYGRPFFFGLWRLPKDCSKLELKVLPLQTDMPVYFPREAATEPGEQVKSIELLAR